jgi:hypothetical protein
MQSDCGGPTLASSVGMTTTHTRMMLLSAVLSAGSPVAPAQAHTLAPVIDPFAPERPAGPAEPEPPTGAGLLAGGAVTFALGLPLLILGASAVEDGQNCQSSDSPCAWRSMGGTILLPLGVLGLAMSVPLLTTGGIRYARRMAWERRHGIALRPGISGGRTWLVGITLHF